MRLRNEVGRDLRGDVGQGAPSTIRCIKTPEPPEPPTGTGPRQGAPSTIRCIKTPLLERGHRLGEHEVREHPAPPGALRLVVDKEIPRPSANAVREHPAPSGAFKTLFQKARSWSSAQVPRGGSLPVLRWRLAPSAALRLPSAVRCAHKGPELGNAVGTQGRDQAVVCDVVLRNSVPCVRNRELRAKEEPPGATGRI